MEKKDILINDIDQFGVESIEQYNRDKEINQVQYFKLIERLDELKVEDFHSPEKFEYFLRYWNQLCEVSRLRAHTECRNKNPAVRSLPTSYPQQNATITSINTKKCKI
ncbi:hypothetical protein [Flavobacterium soyangense]|uniref:Uncharacterized protein n=1 Tax=Flavobacterium soyangense TaxID=2023265 RepID=A0A930UAB2_9FLAO|nr:hypothetical protein [Flavobacterium soyangense]MBF2709858.1 hypothetical protein [Flavobacterium soyangense]